MHGPGLRDSEDAELTAVWGRDLEKATALGAVLGVPGFGDLDRFLEEVDAVTFAVPPDVQAELALHAARAGKHLLLDKPVAADVDAARALRDAARDAGVASVVFFTDRFAARSRAWFEEVRSTDGWRGGWVRWFSALQEPDNPFGSSPWRQERGALWDTGPHALSTLDACLGPVESLTAVGGSGDLVALTLRHVSGALSTVELTQFAPPAAALFDAAVWGEPGLSAMPPRSDEAFVAALTIAAEELVAAAAGRPHEVDVAFGARVVELIAEAQAQIDAAARP
jgi:predicted dehydrogenase